MHTLTRRIAARATAVIAASALLIVGVPTTANAADAYDDLRATWVEMMTGGTGYNPADPDIAAKIDAIDATAQSWWDTLDTSPGRTYLWSDLTSGASTQITSAYTRLKAMALATATHGSDHEGDSGLRADIVSALDWMEINLYNADSPDVTGWWDWEIGAPRLLNDTVAILWDDLSAGQIANYMAAVNEFSPSVARTGANRAWKAEVVAGLGILTKSPTKLVNARDGLSQVFDYSSSGDGFYADGSFIQHNNIAYTGAYGLSTLATVAKLLRLLDGSTWAVVDPDVARVYDWVHDSFEPLVYRGALMDMVRGREISRYYNQDHGAGATTIEAILSLADSAPSAVEASYRSMAKEWLLADTLNDYAAKVTLPGVIRAQDVLDDSGVTPRGELEGYTQFANMDRAVVSRDGWSLGIAMTSSRIVNYEAINSENRKGWYTGTGATYLYNSDVAYYSDGYWPTVNPYRIPGTTIDGLTRGGASNQSTTSGKTWVGGVSLDGMYGASGMDYADVSTNLVAKKSWFAFDDEIVALGAGITSTTGRAALTTVDNRKINATGNNAVRINGVLQGTSLTAGTVVTPGVDRAHIAGSVAGSDVGYYFPTPVALSTVREARTGAWNQIDLRDGAPRTSITRNYETLWLAHGNSPTNAGYSYVTLPGASSAQVDAYATSPDVVVLANTAAAQGVEEQSLGIQAANFWTSTPTTVGDITSDAPASVMIRDVGGELELAVSDPTQLNTGTLHLTIDRDLGSVITPNPRVTVTSYSPTLQLSINLSGSDGQPITARFGPASNPWDVVDEGFDDWNAGWTDLGTAVATQGSGSVTITDDSTISSELITLDGFVPPTGAFTVEAVIKVNSGKAALSVRSGGYLVKLALQHGTSGSAGDALGAKSATLNTTVSHAYRLVVHSGYTYDLYVDGVLAWSGAAAGAGGTDKLIIGLGAPETGAFEVDAVRIGLGELVP